MFPFYLLEEGVEFWFQEVWSLLVICN